MKSDERNVVTKGVSKETCARQLSRSREITGTREMGSEKLQPPKDLVLVTPCAPLLLFFLFYSPRSSFFIKRARTAKSTGIAPVPEKFVLTFIGNNHLANRRVH